MNATDRLRELQEQRDAAGARVGGIEDERRQAVAAVQQASTELAEAERVGFSAAKRHQLEEALAKAKSRAGEPWAERIAGGQAAIRDADRALREHVAANLAALITVIEAAGEAAAAQVDQAAAALVAAFQEREAIAAQLGQLITMVQPPGPGDVSFSRADEARRAAAELLAEGGEMPVTLAKDRAPWDAILRGDGEPEAITGTDRDESEQVVGVVA